MLTKFPSANIQLAREAFDAARVFAAMIRARAVDLDNRAAAGSVKSEHLMRFIDDTEANLAMLQAGVDGVGLDAVEAYAKLSLLDSEGWRDMYLLMVDTVGGTLDWFVGNLPKDPSGVLMAQTIAARGKRVEVPLSTPFLDGLRETLQTLIAVID